MGFRILRKFNIAMLTKQGCRILTQADLLVSNIMNACYFPDTGLLAANLRLNQSYPWRSIMMTQEQVRLRCKRRIDNGETTEVWGRPWLLCTENPGFMITPEPIQLQNISVKILLMHKLGLGILIFWVIFVNQETLILSNEFQFRWGIEGIPDSGRWMKEDSIL